MGVLGRGTNLLRGIVDRRRREREMKAGRWVDDLAGDVRYALRYFARTPLLTLTIVLTLMLGIGTNSALLAVLDGLTTRPARRSR